MTDEHGNDEDEQEKKLPPLPASEKAASDSANDIQSTAETKQLSSGLPLSEIKKRAEENEADRTETFRDHFECLAIISLYLIWIVVVAIGLTWVYHLLAPPCWPRLPDEQIRHMQSLLTGGVLAGLATGHAKRRLGG